MSTQSNFLLLSEEDLEQEERSEIEEIEEYEEVIDLFKILKKDSSSPDIFFKNIFIRNPQLTHKPSRFSRTRCFKAVPYFILYCRLKLDC